MMKAIVCTSAQFKVEIVYPAARWMRAVTNGGFGRADEAVEAAVMTKAGAASQIDNKIASGIDPDLARRYVKAMVMGGEVTAGALDLIRLHDAGHLSDHAVLDVAAISTDRLLRDAWRRSPANGGAIYVDMPAARAVFSGLVIAAKRQAVVDFTAGAERAMVAGDNPTEFEVLYASLIAMDLRALGVRVFSVQTPAALKALWPTELPKPRAL